MSAMDFNRADAERRLGPAAVAVIRRQAAEAPPLRPEQRERLRAIFASARVMAAADARPAQAA